MVSVSLSAFPTTLYSHRLKKSPGRSNPPYTSKQSLHGPTLEWPKAFEAAVGIK
jgi:hypothetical protein